MLHKILLTISLVFIFSFYTSVVNAQDSPKKNASLVNKKNDKADNQKKVPQNLVALLNQARSVPPEFCADVIIRVVESRKINDKQTNIELLKEAFEQTNQAQLKGKKTVFKSINIDTRVGYLDKAYELNLDTISLNCRIVNALLELDKNIAKEYFSKISITSFIKESLSCKDLAVYDVTAYYETAKKIAEQCFTKKEIEQGFRERFIEEQIVNITSAVELSHVAKLIISFNWSPLDLEILLGAYSNKVDHLITDYRTFIASELLYRVTESIHNLASYCEKKQVASKYLVKSYREYLVSNLSQKTCFDINEKLIAELIFRANSRLFRANPIILKDLALEHEETFIEDPPFFSSEKSKLISSQIRKLYANTQQNRTTDNTNKEKDLEEAYSEFVKIFRNWKASDEPTEEDYLHQKATIYQNLIEIAQTEKQKDELLYEYLLFLRDFKLENISRAEWFVHLNVILKMLQGSNQESRAKIIGLLNNSQNAVAELYTAVILEGL